MTRCDLPSALSSRGLRNRVSALGCCVQPACGLRAPWQDTDTRGSPDVACGPRNWVSRAARLDGDREDITSEGTCKSPCCRVLAVLCNTSIQNTTALFSQGVAHRAALGGVLMCCGQDLKGPSVPVTLPVGVLETRAAPLQGAGGMGAEETRR